jgi:hypothetical protein
MKKKQIGHAEKVRAERERQLDLDFDGDGLTEREELKYGLNPLRPDSDGDGIYDGKEVATHSNPRDAADALKAQLREKYVELARHATQHQELDYEELLAMTKEQPSASRRLDHAVVAYALISGMSRKETKLLLSQSPYLQSRVASNEWGEEDAYRYANFLAGEDLEAESMESD